MDLAFLEFPTQFLKKDVFQLREWTAYSVKRARKVVAISTFTKKQVMRVYHKQVKDVIVIPPAVEPVVTVSASDRSSALERLGATQPFLLYVGTLQPRKNIRRLVEAYEYLRTHGEGTTLLRSEGRGRSAKVGRLRKELSQVFQLVIAGKPGWLSDAILERIEVSPFRSDIVVTGFVNDLEKAALLSSAAAVVQVGLYEGFGIPPLEALQYGVIPVVANTTSLPEVVGKAGILVDPLDVKSIARGCAEALSLSAKDRAGMLKAGREQLKRYTWEKAGNTLIEVLKKVASGKA
jgi:glycosyltransferase involved in cell wall biosynthesis